LGSTKIIIEKGFIILFNIFLGVFKMEAVKEKNDLFNLDVKVNAKESNDSGAEPRIASKFICTPGCAKTGSFNSYCC
jgi:lantibiotic epidermin